MCNPQKWNVQPEDGWVLGGIRLTQDGGSLLFHFHDHWICRRHIFQLSCYHDGCSTYAFWCVCLIYQYFVNSNGQKSCLTKINLWNGQSRSYGCNGMHSHYLDFSYLALYRSYNENSKFILGERIYTWSKNNAPDFLHKSDLQYLQPCLPWNVQW